MATLLSPDMLPEDIRNMDFGQASMPQVPEAQTTEVPYDMTASAPDRPAIPLSPDMLSGNPQGNGSEKSGIEFSFDAFGYTQQVELVRESYADGNLAVTAYLSDPTDESFGQPWSSVTVNFGSPLQQDATVFLDTNNMGEAMLSKISQLGAFTGQFMRSGFCSYPAFIFDTEVMGNMRDLNEFASADHSSLAKMQDACHAALENVYGSEFTDALESGYAVKPCFLKLHAACKISNKHLIRHVAPFVRITNGRCGKSDYLCIGIIFHNVLNALSPFRCPAVMELVCHYHIAPRNLIPASCFSHCGCIGHKLQILRSESGSDIGKVRHLADIHVIIGTEKKEVFSRIVLCHLSNDDEFARAGWLHDTSTVVIPEHGTEVIVGFLIVRVEFDFFHFHFPFRGNISCIIASFVSVRFPDFTGSLPFTLTNPSKRILNTGSVVSTALCLANGS